MRQATVNDLNFIGLVAKHCGLPSLPDDAIERCLVFVGESGYFLLDMQDDHTAIVHVAIIPEGRGWWANKFFKAFLAWAFTATRLERINAMVPRSDKHVKRFGLEAGMRVVAETPRFTFLDIDILRWMAYSDECLQEGKADDPGYEFSDPEMIKRISGACSLMHEAGMEHKAWYVYELCAKLFGYRTEA